MGKKTGIFTEGQLVYAKVKGYSPWPAKITKVIAKHKYGVYFYGTGETGNCKSEELDPYDERNRSRFNTDRQMKKPDYKEAVDQIEAAVNGNDPAPIIQATNDESIKEENVTIKTDADISQDTEDFDPDESQLQIAEDIPKSTPAPKKKAPVAKPKAILTPTPVVPPPLESESKENDEKISRSGRKIKEKKMNNDEMDPDEVFTYPRKRLKVEEVKATKTPATLNDSAINEFCLSKMHILQDPVRKQFLTTQFEMISIIQDIKQALGLEHVYVDQALSSLKTLKEKTVPNITKLMLLKYSNTVATIKRLKNYIGNVSSWNLEADKLKDFEEKAKEIRTIAAEVYDSFKSLFPEALDSSSFWVYFADEQKQFLDKFEKIDPSDLFEAYKVEELESFVNKITCNDDAQVPQLPETAQTEDN